MTMTDPKALVFSGQEGTGAAQLLVSDPNTQVQQGIDRLLDFEWEKLKKKEEQDKKAKEALAKLSTYDPLIPQSQAELEKKYGEIRDVYVGARTLGVDPEDITTPEGRKFWEMQNKIALDNTMNKEFVDWRDKTIAEFQKNADKYDPEMFEKAMDEVMSKGSIKERFETAKASNPLVPRIDFYEGMDTFKPEVEVIVRETPGGVTTTTSKLPEQSAEQSAKRFLASKLVENPTFIEAGIAKGLWTDSESALKHYADEYKRTTKTEDKVTREQRGSMNISVGGFGGGTEAAGLVATSSTSPAFSKYGGVNEVMFTQKGKDIAPVALSNYQGKAEFVKPEKVIFKQNKDGKDQWFVVGKKAKRASGDQIEREAKARKMDTATYMAELGWEPDPENPNEFVSIKETETLTLPVSSQPGSYGEANYKKISAIMGEDFYDFIRRENAGKTTGKTTGGGQVTDVSNIFGGQ